MQNVTIPQSSPCAPAIMADAIQDAFDSLNSGNLGADRPAYITAGGFWSKQVSATSIRRYFFDGTNDILVSDYNPVSGVLTEINIPDLGVGLGKLAAIASGRILGRVSVSTGAVESLTMAQVMANLPDLVGDSGSGGVAGRCPAPPAGSDSLDYFLGADGTWKATPVGVLPGQFAWFAMDVAPLGFLECYGQAVSRSTYANLYAAIGDTWGPGNGSTTFNLPDARGRVIAGWDMMGGVSGDRLLISPDTVGGLNGDIFATAGGNYVHLLTEPQMPAHNHGAVIKPGSANASTGGSPQGQTGTTDTKGGNKVHNIVQPTIIGLICIKY